MKKQVFKICGCEIFFFFFFFLATSGQWKLFTSGIQTKRQTENTALPREQLTCPSPLSFLFRLGLLLVLLLRRLRVLVAHLAHLPPHLRPLALPLLPPPSCPHLVQPRLLSRLPEPLLTRGSHACSPLTFPDLEMTKGRLPPQPAWVECCDALTVVNLGRHEQSVRAMMAPVTWVHPVYMLWDSHHKYQLYVPLDFVFP